MKKYFIVSATLHLCLVLTLLIGFSWWYNSNPFGNKINVYIDNKNDRDNKSFMNLPRDKLTTSDSNEYTQIKIKRQSHRRNMSSVASVKTKVKGHNASNNESLTKLTWYLHNLIQAHIRHPTNIPIISGARRVSITFLLYPDGHIENVTLLQSTGAAIFDSAALNTITTLPKIIVAKDLLYEPKQMTVSVEFH